MQAERQLIESQVIDVHDIQNVFFSEESGSSNSQNLNENSMIANSTTI